MRRHLLFRLLFCILLSASVLYVYIDKQNKITELKIEIPKLKEEVRVLREMNASLALQIEELESPKHLIAKMGRSQFSHLRYPSRILIVEEDE